MEWPAGVEVGELCPCRRLFRPEADNPPNQARRCGPLHRRPVRPRRFLGPKTASIGYRFPSACGGIPPGTLEEVLGGGSWNGRRAEQGRDVSALSLVDGER